MWAHYLMAFIVSSIVSQVGTLAICFFKKHQTISKLMNKHLVPAGLVQLAYFGAPFVPILIFVLFLQTGMGRDNQMDYVKEYYPELYSNFLQLQNFAIYNFTIWVVIIAFIAFSGTIICGFLFIFTTVDMYQFLNSVQLKTQISTTNYKRHQAALRSLVAQFVTSSLCLAPPALYSVVILTNLSYAQVIVQILLSIFCLHSIVNAMVLVLTTPPYRSFVLRKQPKRSLIVVPVSISRVSGI